MLKGEHEGETDGLEYYIHLSKMSSVPGGSLSPDSRWLLAGRFCFESMCRSSLYSHRLLLKKEELCVPALCSVLSRKLA